MVGEREKSETRKLLAALCCCLCSSRTAPFMTPSPGNADAALASSSATPSESQRIETKQSVRSRQQRNSEVRTISPSHNEAPAQMVYDIFHVPLILLSPQFKELHCNTSDSTRKYTLAHLSEVDQYFLVVCDLSALEAPKDLASSRWVFKN